MVITQDLFINETTSGKTAMNLIDSNSYGVVFVLDKKKSLIGVITPGDIRRAIDKGFDIETPVIACMNKKPLHIPEGLNTQTALSRIVKALAKREKKISESIYSIKIPILNKKKQVTGIVTYNQGEKNISLAFNSSSEPHNDVVKKVLLVGGAGYLGSVLVKLLLKEGYQVRVLDSLIFGRQAIEEHLSNSHFELVIGDMRDIQTIHKCLDGVDAVIHLAAIVGDPASQKYPSDTIGVNYLATVTLAMACKYYQINRFIFASTCSVYGIGSKRLDEKAELHPVSLYARTKIESEKGILHLSDANFKPVIMRMSTLYGLSPRMRFDLVVNTFAKMATTKQFIEILGGNQWRPFIHVEDAARAYLTLLKTPLNQLKTQVFNVGTNSQNHTIKELGAFVTQTLPKTKVVIKKPLKNQKADGRTYFVSFDEIEKALHFTAHHNIKDSILEISQAITTGLIKDVEAKQYYNCPQ